MNKFLLIAFIFPCLISGQQNRTIDSLLNILKTTKEDTNQLNVLNVLIAETYDEIILTGYVEKAYHLSEKLEKNNNAIIKIRGKRGLADALGNFGFIYQNRGDFPKAIEYYKKSLKLFEQVGDKIGISQLLNNLGLIHTIQGNIPDGLAYYERSLKIREEIGDKKGIALTLTNIGVIYGDQGDIPKSLDYYSRSLKLQEEIGDKDGMAQTLNNIGTIYNSQKDFQNSLDYYNRSLKLQEEIDDKKGIAYSLTNIGVVNGMQGNFTGALDYYNRSLKIREEIGDKVGIAQSLHSIAVNYDHQGKLSESLEYYRRSLRLRKEIGDKQGVASSLIFIGLNYFKQKKYVLAASYSDSSLSVAKQLGFPENIRNAEVTLSRIYSATGNYKQAFEHYKQFIIYRDSIENEGTRKASVKRQLKYEYEKKAVADSVKVHEEKKVISAQLKEEKTKSFALYGGLGLVMVFAGFMVNRFRVTNKQKKIIELKEHETQKQNEIISHQKHLVEEKHKEITDSINYAERIQRSFLATKNLLDENLKEYFVFFQPKDVVSGDFYWASILSNNNFVLATADSTGHGVPGAIMSILNISSLEKAVDQGLFEPSEIFNSTRKTIIERLKKDGSENGGKDGMDCSLIAFDFKNSCLTYSAANNPVWIVRRLAPAESGVTSSAPDSYRIGVKLSSEFFVLFHCVFSVISLFVFALF